MLYPLRCTNVLSSGPVSVSPQLPSEELDSFGAAAVCFVTRAVEGLT